MVPSSPSMMVIPWHRRLEARVLLSVTIIAGLSVLAVVGATSQVVNRFSLGRSHDDVLAAREAFSRIIDTHAEFAARETRLIVELPVFRASLNLSPGAASGSADAATVAEMTAYYCRKLEANFCIVSDAKGRWIGETGWPLGQSPADVITAAIAQTSEGRSFQDTVTIGDELFLVIAEPALFAQEVLGTLTAGYRLDDGVASELALVARCDVNFICRGNRLCGSSLPARDQTALRTLLEAKNGELLHETSTPALRTIGGTSYLGGAYALRGSHNGAAAADAPRLVLLQDVSSTELALEKINGAILRIGAITFAISVGGILVLTRQTTRPLRDLVTVARDVASGNWARRVPIDGPAEARTMAEAFNHMTSTLSHWHQEAQDRAQQLHESYERFRSITDSANDAIISVNQAGDVVFWNLRAAVVFGYDESEALGRPVARLLPEKHRAEFVEEVARLRAGDTSWLGRSIELAALRRDGTEVPVELSLSTWRAGTDLYYTGVIRDITERRQAAEALAQREEQLRHAQKMEAVGRLAGGIAHDFNNLLTAILGYADLLLEELPADHPMRRDLEGIQKAGRSAASLTKELLAFSRKQVLQPVVLDMNQVVSTTEILMRRLLGEDVELVLQLETHPEPVRADRSQLEQVLLNLVVNARDAMPEGGRLTISTSNFVLGASAGGRNLPAAVGAYVVLTVSDTGHGMTEEVRSHIFEPFFTTKELGKGTGLGLATVYGIVQQSGGHIWVESEPGKGASFHVCLPIVEEAPADASTADADPGRHGSETILLVEDNDSVRNLARDALTRYGYAVIEARHGAEALSIASGQLDRISLVLTDVVMPVMGGRELASRLTALRPDLKIIFTSGYTTEAITSQSGASAFLQKPFSPTLLGQTVRDVLDMTVV
jgi:PAS domain S-box-containing protein